MSDEPELECARCDFRGEDLREHAAEAGHWLCIVCYRSLREDESQTCQPCVTRARGFLAAIEEAFTELPDVIEASGYRSLAFPGGDALVMAVDGNLGGTWVDHHDGTWSRYTPCDSARYHDPDSVLAVLELNERGWRLEFGHGPAEGIATVAGCLAYLQQWLWLAARTHPGFDDFYREIRSLQSRLAFMAATGDQPLRLPANCFDCNGTLIRLYTDPIKPIGEGRRGLEREGLSDIAECSSCRREYDTESYGLALRMRVASTEGFVPVKLAAETSRRPERTIWNWLRDGLIPSACSVKTRRVLVEWEAVKDRDTLTSRRARGTGLSAA